MHRANPRLCFILFSCHVILGPASRFREDDVAGPAAQAVGQDNRLLAAFDRGLVGAATVQERSAMTNDLRSASLRALGQDVNLATAFNRGLGGASTVKARTAMSADARATAIQWSG